MGEMGGWQWEQTLRRHTGVDRAGPEWYTKVFDLNDTSNREKAKDTE